VVVVSSSQRNTSFGSRQSFGSHELNYEKNDFWEKKMKSKWQVNSNLFERPGTNRFASATVRFFESNSVVVPIDASMKTETFVFAF